MNNPLYLCETLPFSQEIILDIIPRYWHQDENLFKGNIPKKELSFMSTLEVYKNLENYLQHQKWEVDVSTIPKWDVDFDNYLENWVKFVWLSKEYLTKGFRNPVGAHYNPRMKNHVIHPGGCRQQVLNLFHNGFIPAIYFNTGGVKPKWLKKMQKVSPQSLVDQGWDINLVADHGSLIPHLLKDLESIVIGKIQTQIMVQKNLCNLSFCCDRKIDILQPWQTKKTRKARFIVKIFSGDFQDNIVKASACMLSDIEYSDTDLQVFKK